MFEDPPATASGDPSGPGEAADVGGDERWSFTSWLRELALLAGFALVAAYAIKVFVVQPFYIPTGSMEPTVMPQDRILVSKLAYYLGEPRRGDIVVFAAPHDAEGRDFLKRIVALGGETVSERDGQIFVNGKRLAEPYVSPVRDHSDFPPIRVPKGDYFVMGDNRSNSSDSRVFGPLSRRAIRGKAVVIYWPLSLGPGRRATL
jgi:signal peptidase I